LLYGQTSEQSPFTLPKDRFTGVASLVERAPAVLTARQSHHMDMLQDRLLMGTRRRQPWNWFSAAMWAQCVGLGAYGQPICRTRSGRALFLSPRDRDVTNMGRAAKTTAAHTVRGCRLPAVLDMAAPIIWSCYHRRLRFNSVETMLAEL
jgi:hypothetical protein